MLYGVYYEGNMHLSVDANSPSSAWDKLHGAGIMNKSRILRMREIDPIDDPYSGFFNVVDSIISPGFIIPSKQSINFRR